MANSKLSAGSAAAEIRDMLDSPEITALIAELERTRWTGRPGYRIRSQIGMTLVKHLYCIPFWSRTIALVEEHDGLRGAIGCTGSGEPDGVPSEDALRRFRDKLIDHSNLRTDCFDQILNSLGEQFPEMGEHIAIDGSLLLANANGYDRKNGRKRKPEEFSDADASWVPLRATSNRTGGRGYGYKLHMAIDTATELPVAWHINTGSAYEGRFAPGLLDETQRRGFAATTCALDRGYDDKAIYAEFEDRDCHPIIPIKNTGAVKKNKHLPHECRHGVWVFKGADRRRKAAKWRCPTGECKVSNRWVPASRLHTLVPRTTKRWERLYRRRSAIEREFGRLKDNYGLRSVRARRMRRVRLHADLAILARLASALARARSA